MTQPSPTTPGHQLQGKRCAEMPPSTTISGAPSGPATLAPMRPPNLARAAGAGTSNGWGVQEAGSATGMATGDKIISTPFRQGEMLPRDPLGCRTGRIVPSGPPPCPGRQVGVGARPTLDASRQVLRPIAYQFPTQRAGAWQGFLADRRG